MKQLIILCFIVISPLLFAQQHGKETIVIKTHTDCNHCKVCESCGLKMETDLYFVRGIKSVIYNEADMTITVVYKPKAVTPDKIRQAISKLGFAADDVPADPEAYEKLDACCKRK